MFQTNGDDKAKAALFRQDLSLQFASRPVTSELVVTPSEFQACSQDQSMHMCLRSHCADMEKNLEAAGRGSLWRFFLYPKYDIINLQHLDDGEATLQRIEVRDGVHSVDVGNILIQIRYLLSLIEISHAEPASQWDQEMAL